MATTTSRTTRAFTLTSFKAATDEFFKKAIDSDVELINVGSLPVFHRTLSEEGVIEDLRTAFGNEDADLIFSLAACLVETGELSYPFFDGWRASHYLPLTGSVDLQKFNSVLQKVDISSKEVQRFFTARAHRNQEEPVIVYASSFQDDQLLWPSVRLTSSEEKTAERALLTVIGSKTGMPTLLQPFPGTIGDFRTFLGYLVAIKETGIKKINNVVLGSEFFSEVALLRTAQARAKCIFVLPKSSEIYMRLLPSALQRLEGVDQLFKFAGSSKRNPAFTTTYPIELSRQGHKIPAWVHFIDNAKCMTFDENGLYSELVQFEQLWDSQPELRSVLETEPLMQYFSIVESSKDGVPIAKLQREDNEITRTFLKNRLLGLVSTWECDADECLEEISVKPVIAEMVNTAMEMHLQVERPTREGADAMLFLAFIGYLIKAGIRKNIVKAGKAKAKPEVDWNRLDSFLRDSDKVIGALEGFSYLRRKSNKSFVALPPNLKQKKAIELCGMDGILDSVYQY